jgi:carboxyl-terminal processing protease
MADSILDKYSDYYTKEEYDIIKKSAKGIRYGVGLAFLKNSEGIFIDTVLGNSPSENAGVKVGGKVLGITTDGEFKPADENFFTVMDGIENGESYSLKISYDGEENVFDLTGQEYSETFVYYTDSQSSYRFSDKNGTSSMAMVKWQTEIDGLIPEKTGYIRYTSFSGTKDNIYGSATQIKTVLEKFKEDGNSKLILDLRGNGGGYMDIMFSVASHFIGVKNGGKVLVSQAEYKKGKVDKFYSNKVDYLNYGFEKIVILADDGTASASEALIGACLDYDTRNIVNVVLSRSEENGEYVYRTYGKGIMQTTYENFTMGDAIKLTTAKIYWPTSNVCIHDVGITKEIDIYKDKIIEAPYIENADYELIAALSL